MRRWALALALLSCQSTPRAEPDAGPQPVPIDFAFTVSTRTATAGDPIKATVTIANKSSVALAGLELRATVFGFAGDPGWKFDATELAKKDSERFVMKHDIVPAGDRSIVLTFTTSKPGSYRIAIEPQKPGLALVQSEKSLSLHEEIAIDVIQRAPAGGGGAGCACTDGTPATCCGHRGCCSHHGGVQ